MCHLTLEANIFIQGYADCDLTKAYPIPLSGPLRVTRFFIGWANFPDKYVKKLPDSIPCRRSRTPLQCRPCNPYCSSVLKVHLSSEAWWTESHQGIDPRNRFLVRKSIPLWNWSWRHRFYVKELKILDFLLSYVVCGERTPLLVNTFPLCKQNGLGVGRGWKVDSCIKIYILWDMTDSIPHLVLTQFQESIFPDCSKVLAQEDRNKNVVTKYWKTNHLCSVNPHSPSTADWHMFAFQLFVRSRFFYIIIINIMDCIICIFFNVYTCITSVHGAWGQVVGVAQLIAGETTNLNTHSLLILL